jgi:hypothetical protein
MVKNHKDSSNRGPFFVFKESEMANMILFDLKKAIIKSGLKQGYIARQAGIEETRLSKAIHGHRPLSKNDEKNLAKALGMRVEDLFPQKNTAS